MATATQQHSLALTEEERTHLLEVLSTALRDTRIEVHRTDAPDYREWVERREAILEDVVRRLQDGLGAQSPAAHREAL
jgi:hypothetical protein